MTFEEYWGEDPDPGKITAKHAWNAAQKAEREKLQELIAAAEAIFDDHVVFESLRVKLAALRDVIERMKNDD